MSIESPTVEPRPTRPLPPPGLAPTRLWLAAIVPGCAVVMLIIVILINVVTATPPPPKSLSTHLQKVSGLSPGAANPFVPLIIAGEPVDDILNAVVIPSGSTQVAIPPVGGEPTSFDHTIIFTSTASEAAIYTFFHDEMIGRGWKIFSTGVPADQNGVELLGQKAGTDGWFWELGVVVSPTTFSQSGTQVTRFSVRLYQASDSA